MSYINLHYDPCDEVIVRTEKNTDGVSMPHSGFFSYIKLPDVIDIMHPYTGEMLYIRDDVWLPEHPVTPTPEGFSEAIGFISNALDYLDTNPGNSTCPLDDLIYCATGLYAHNGKQDLRDALMEHYF